MQPEPSRVLEKAKRAEELGPCRACTICITPCWPCAKARCVAGVQVREMSQWQTVFVTMHGGDHEKERQAPNEDAHEAGISREPICLPRVPMQQQPTTTSPSCLDAINSEGFQAGWWVYVVGLMVGAQLGAGLQRIALRSALRGHRTVGRDGTVDCEFPPLPNQPGRGADAGRQTLSPSQVGLDLHNFHSQDTRRKLLGRRPACQ